MKAVLISIKPKWCDLIRRGRKTVEVRKTCPKLEVPFKVYIYETMDGGRGSGLVFGEFVCNGFDVFRPIGKGISIKRFPALYESCLTLDEIVKYAQGEPVYGWQISEALRGAAQAGGFLPARFLWHERDWRLRQCRLRERSTVWQLYGAAHLCSQWLHPV